MRKKVMYSLVIGTLLAGMYFTALGLSDIDYSAVAIPGEHLLYVYLGLATVGGLFVEVFSRWCKIPRLVAGGGAIAMLAILTGAAWPLLICLIFLTSAFISGRYILSLLAGAPSQIPPIIALLVGTGLYGTAVSLAVHFPYNYAGIYGIGLVIPIIIGRQYLAELGGAYTKFASPYNEFRYMDLAICIIGLVYITTALMPEVGSDALCMHLFIAEQVAYNHQWGFDVDKYVFAVMPTMVDWLYTIVNMLGGETAARLLNVSFVFILAWLIRDLIIWAGGDSRGGRWTVIIFLSTPLTLLEASSLYIELIWTAFILAGVLSILKLISSDHIEKEKLLAIGLLMAFALAAKAITFTILPVLFLLLVVFYKSWLKASLVRTILMGLALFLLIGAIPYLTAWLKTGNPVFPFFNEFFQSPYYPAENFDASLYGKGISWDTIYQITFDAPRYLEAKVGAAGFQWLLLLLPAMTLILFSRHRNGMVLIFIGIAPVILSFYQTAYLRYIFPSVAILCAVIGLGISNMIAERRRSWLVSVAVSLVVILNLGFFSSATWYGDINVWALASQKGRDDYLRQRLPIRGVINTVNELNVRGKPVVVFANPMVAGLRADGIYPNWYNQRFRKAVFTAKDTVELADRIFAVGAEYIILDDSWRTSERRYPVEDATEVIMRSGNITLRVLKPKYIYREELMANIRFLSTDHWHLSANAQVVDGEVSVNNEITAVQFVKLSDKRKYKLAGKARCINTDSQGRLQVNWLDGDSQLIGTSINVFDCQKELTNHTYEVDAPTSAEHAVVFVGGHVSEPLLFTEMSFRQ